MKIIVSQQDKKLSVTFKDKKLEESFVIDKAEEFLGVIDKFIKRRKIGLATLKKADLKFDNVGLLTERTIRAIILGLSINKF